MNHNGHSDFWKNIFEKESLALRMPDIGNHPGGISFDSPIYRRVNLTASPASTYGDNFFSVVYLVQAVLEDGATYRSFVKIMPRIKSIFEGAMEMKVFRREAAIYRHFHFELRQIRAETGLSENELPLNVPELYYAHLDESGGNLANSSVLVMEDLKYLGFRLVDKYLGCTKEEAKIALSTLARYHALSIAAIQKWKLQDGGSLVLPEPLSYIPARTLLDDGIQHMVLTQVLLQIRMLKELGYQEAGLWLEQEHLARTDKVLNETLTPQAIEKYGLLACITHSDCWNNNMLYRYSEDGKPVEMKLIDWQITRLGHPCSDVVHFLFSSAAPEVLFEEEGLQELLNHYYEILSSSLEKLGLAKVVLNCNRRQFLEEAKERFHFGLLMALMILPGILKNRDSEIQTNEAKEDLKKKDDFARLLENKLLCERVIKLVEGVKANLNKI